MILQTYLEKSALNIFLVRLPHSVDIDSSLMDGSYGTNRAEPSACQINVRHDYEAVQCWLNEYKHKETTFRNYQKEAERLLLWCVIQHRKPLSSLNRDDFEAYLNFLQNPQPASIWCAPKGGRNGKRGSPQWKPFVKGLSPTAIANAMTIINSLMQYLVEARYLKANPLGLIRKHTKWHMDTETQSILIQERILETELWYAILETIEALPAADQKQQFKKTRTLLLFGILYLLGLRIHELESHTWNSFQRINQHWWFVLIGKGDKPGMIPVNDELLTLIMKCRIEWGLAPYPKADETMPIIPSIKKQQGISARQMNNIIKKIVHLTAERFKDQPQKVAKLKKVSAHWLRHLSATMQDAAGIDEKLIQQNHRHSNIATTRKYIHSEQVRRHEAMQKLKLKR